MISVDLPLLIRCQCPEVKVKKEEMSAGVDVEGLPVAMAGSDSDPLKTEVSQAYSHCLKNYFGSLLAFFKGIKKGSTLRAI